jgi:hypothetical protein
MVPKLLSDEQKEHHKELCLGLLQCTDNETDLLNLIITCNESLLFIYDLETKVNQTQVLVPRHPIYQEVFYITAQ